MTVRNFINASSLIGLNVINPQDEDIGKIKDLVVNLRSGETAYAILSFGGFLGMGDKLFAIPFSLLRFDRKQEVVILNIEKSILEKAPGFHKQSWPNFNDREWIDEIETYYCEAFNLIDEEELV
jgi:sporulation protein YlmC with PRC-barrel domain